MPDSPSKPLPLLMNPKAGSLFRSGLDTWLHGHRQELRIIPTQSPADVTEQARRLADAGEPVVLAAGGDGTLKLAAQGLMGTDSALGIFPCGTMNVFAREMGIGSRKFDLALKAACGEARQMVDLFAVNGTPFLQMAGFGPDASVIKLITPWMKKRLGAFSHVLTGIRVATRHHPLITLAMANGETVEGTQVIFGNGKRYGGATHLFSEAAYDDGILDAAIIHMEAPGILYEILSYMVQNGIDDHNLGDTTKIRQMESCVLTADGALDYELDGDYTGTIPAGEPVLVERLPQQLKVCVLEEQEPTTPLGQLMAHPAVHPMVSALMRRIQDLKDY